MSGQLVKSGFSQPRDEALLYYNQLTENEKYQIYALKKARHAQYEIAELPNLNP